jgi:hypothetical protein
VILRISRFNSRAYVSVRVEISICHALEAPENDVCSSSYRIVSRTLYRLFGAAVGEAIEVRPVLARLD